MLTWPSSARTVRTGSMPAACALSASISRAMFLSGASDMARSMNRRGATGKSHRRKPAAPFVEQMQHAIGDGKERPAQGQLVAFLLFEHIGERAQVGEADLDRRLLHRSFGRAAGGTEFPRDRLARFVEHFDPVRDETALARLGAMEL